MNDEFILILFEDEEVEDDEVTSLSSSALKLIGFDVDICKVFDDGSVDIVVADADDAVSRERELFSIRFVGKMCFRP